MADEETDPKLTQLLREKLDKHEKFLDELWDLGRCGHRDVTEILNKIRQFSKENP